METSRQMGKKMGHERKRAAYRHWRRRLTKILKKKQQLWRNNFLAIHQWAHVDPIDKLLITKSIAMNFHSCQTEGLPGEWSPRDLVLMFWTPSASPSSTSLLELPPSLLPPLTSPPYQRSVIWKQSPSISIFVFQSRTKQEKKWPGDPGVDWSEEDRSCLLKKAPVNSGVPSSHWNKRAPSRPDTHSIWLNTFYWQPPALLMKC